MNVKNLFFSGRSRNSRAVESFIGIKQREYALLPQLRSDMCTLRCVWQWKYQRRLLNIEGSFMPCTIKSIHAVDRRVRRGRCDANFIVLRTEKPRNCSFQGFRQADVSLLPPQKARNRKRSRKKLRQRRGEEEVGRSTFIHFNVCWTDFCDSSRLIKLFGGFNDTSGRFNCAVKQARRWKSEDVLESFIH